MGGLTALIERSVALIPLLQAVIVAICFIIGLIFIARAIPRMAIVFESRAAGLSPMGTSYKGPAVSFFIGSLLISLSATISAFLMTFYRQDQAVAASEIFAYAPTIAESLTHDVTSRAIIGLLRFVQFIGLIGFVRGLFILNMASNTGTIGETGRGITHLIGGTLAMNIVVLLGMFEVSFIS